MTDSDTLEQVTKEIRQWEEVASQDAYQEQAAKELRQIEEVAAWATKELAAQVVSQEQKQATSKAVAQQEAAAQVSSA